MRRMVAVPMVVISVIAMAGCWPLFTPIEPGPPARPSPASTYVASTAPAAADGPRRVTRRRYDRTPRAPADAEEEPPHSAPAPPPPSLTLAGEENSRASAERLLDNVDHRLSAIDRGKLGPTDAATYDQASGFARSAHRALAEHDYVVASGLAEKASALTGKLAPEAPR